MNTINMSNSVRENIRTQARSEPNNSDQIHISLTTESARRLPLGEFFWEDNETTLETLPLWVSSVVVFNLETFIYL